MFDLLSYGPLAPPVVLILVALAGALLGLVRGRLGATIALAAIFSLYALATPSLSSWLLRRAEAGVPEQPDFAGAQAIVVLGADVRQGADGELDSLGPYTAERLVYAAEAYRRLQLPVAVSGGPGNHSNVPAGDLMKAALEQLFAIPVKWDENRSGTTWENAVDTKPLLAAAGVTKVVIVTHAWHMRRALWAFDRVGLSAMPWPAPRTALQTREIADFLPRASALQESFFALHELIGGAYYRLRH